MAERGGSSVDIVERDTCRNEPQLSTRYNDDDDDDDVGRHYGLRVNDIEGSLKSQ